MLSSWAVPGVLKLSSTSKVVYGRRLGAAAVSLDRTVDQ